MRAYTQAEARAAIGLPPFEFGNQDASRYGSVVVPGSVPFITNVFPVSDLKNYLNVEHSEDDVLIASMANAACQQIEVFTGRVLIPKVRFASFARQYGCPLPPNVMLPETIYSFDSSSGSAPASNLFHMEGHSESLSSAIVASPIFAPGVAGVGLRIWLADGWPSELDHDGAFLTIEYVPETELRSDGPFLEILIQAGKLLIGGSYENRESEVGVGRIETNPAVQRLLRPLKVLRNWRGSR